MLRRARRLAYLAAVLVACGGNRQAPPSPAPPSLASPSSPALPPSPAPTAPIALATTPAPQPQLLPAARPPSPAAIAEPGTSCTLATGDDNYACTRDGKARLRCAAGKYELASPCKGPAACDVTTGRVVCDDRIADLGDRCVMLPGNANYACSTDGKVMGVCQEPGQIHLWTRCRGKKGCVTVRFSARCDESIGREGEHCETPTDVACSEDGRSQLTCADNLVWGKAQDCKGGCRITQGAGDEADDLSCD
jgi:hypothetical protein